MLLLANANSTSTCDGRHDQLGTRANDLPLCPPPFSLSSHNQALFTELWILQKKVPVVPLFGRVCWFVADFMGKYAPVDLRNLTPSGRGILTLRTELLNSQDEAFQARTEDLYNQLTVWMVRMDSELAPSAQHNISTVLNARSKLILNGILLSNQIRNLVQTNVFLHLNLRESFRAKNIRSYAICCEMLNCNSINLQQACLNDQ